MWPCAILAAEDYPWGRPLMCPGLPIGWRMQDGGNSALLSSSRRIRGHLSLLPARYIVVCTIEKRRSSETCSRRQYDAIAPAWHLRAAAPNMQVARYGKPRHALGWGKRASCLRGPRLFTILGQAIDPTRCVDPMVCHSQPCGSGTPGDARGVSQKQPPIHLADGARVNLVSWS